MNRLWAYVVFNFDLCTTCRHAFTTAQWELHCMGLHYSLLYGFELCIMKEKVRRMDNNIEFSSLFFSAFVWASTTPGAFLEVLPYLKYCTCSHSEPDPFVHRTIILSDKYYFHKKDFFEFTLHLFPVTKIDSLQVPKLPKSNSD